MTWIRTVSPRCQGGFCLFTCFRRPTPSSRFESRIDTVTGPPSRLVIRLKSLSLCNSGPGTGFFVTHWTQRPELRLTVLLYRFHSPSASSPYRSSIPSFGIVTDRRSDRQVVGKGEEEHRQESTKGPFRGKGRNRVHQTISTGGEGELEVPIISTLSQVQNSYKIKVINRVLVWILGSGWLLSEGSLKMTLIVLYPTKVKRSRRYKVKTMVHFCRMDFYTPRIFFCRKELFP